MTLLMSHPDDPEYVGAWDYVKAEEDQRSWDEMGASGIDRRDGVACDVADEMKNGLSIVGHGPERLYSRQKMVEKGKGKVRGKVKGKEQDICFLADSADMNEWSRNRVGGGGPAVLELMGRERTVKENVAEEENWLTGFEHWVTCFHLPYDRSQRKEQINGNTGSALITKCQACGGGNDSGITDQLMFPPDPSRSVHHPDSQALGKTESLCATAFSSEILAAPYVNPLYSLQPAASTGTAAILALHNEKLKKKKALAAVSVCGENKASRAPSCSHSTTSRLSSKSDSDSMKTTTKTYSPKEITQNNAYRCGPTFGDNSRTVSSNSKAAPGSKYMATAASVASAAPPVSREIVRRPHPAEIMRAAFVNRPKTVYHRHVVLPKDHLLKVPMEASQCQRGERAENMQRFILQGLGINMTQEDRDRMTRAKEIRQEKNPLQRGLKMKQQSEVKKKQAKIDKEQRDLEDATRKHLEMKS